MQVAVVRKNSVFKPDAARVVARFFDNGDSRTALLANRLQAMSKEDINAELQQTLDIFESRHRNITAIFIKHAEKYKDLINRNGQQFDKMSMNQRLLLGSYCTMEYALESAALFNPSIVEDFDQTLLQAGEKRVILSFRATGEGHLSSIVFRKGVLDAANNLKMIAPHNHVDLPRITRKKTYNKKRFVNKMYEMKIPAVYSEKIMQDLPDFFEYHQIRDAVQKIQNSDIDNHYKQVLQEMTWLLDSYYDIEFHGDSPISSRAILPISPSESRGIEDARFVKFTDDDGSEKMYATYTAYDGFTVLPKLLSTSDFLNFRIKPMHGNGVQNKNFALFPRKIKGKYAMLARIDGINNYLLYSDRLTLWNDPIKIQEPKFPWEFTQIGNCGSPIYTEEGWLIITHGVGPMRRYCIGASLLDLEDPTIEIGRLSEPLLSPLEEERDGYVPNVVYSCGSLLHHDDIVLPYAVSDYSSSYVTINKKELIKALIESVPIK